jgi:hypothetical protein
MLKMESVLVQGSCTHGLRGSAAFIISYLKPIEKYLDFEPRSGTKSQIYSQGKLTMLRNKNLKIRHRNNILKPNEWLYKVSIEWYQKTYAQISWDYPFKNYKHDVLTAWKLTVPRFFSLQGSFSKLQCHYTAQQALSQLCKKLANC